MAESSITWTIDCRIDPDQQDSVRELAGELTQMCLQEEPGTLGYEWSVDPAGCFVHIYERYSDSEAAMAHIRLFEANFAERFRALMRPERVVLIGSPSDELLAALAALSPQVLQPIAGFHR